MLCCALVVYDAVVAMPAAKSGELRLESERTPARCKVRLPAVKLLTSHGCTLIASGLTNKACELLLEIWPDDDVVVYNIPEWCQMAGLRQIKLTHIRHACSIYILPGH